MKTINGGRKTLSIVSLKIKIFNIEETMKVFVIEEQNFDHEFLTGLDCIQKFRLIQNEELEISQKMKPQNEVAPKGEKKNS